MLLSAMLARSAFSVCVWQTIGLGIAVGWAWGCPALAEPASTPSAPSESIEEREAIDRSPVLRRWLVEPPDVLYDIYNAPSFPTRLRANLTARDSALGLDLGMEDAFLGKTPLTVSASYQAEFSGKERGVDAHLRYYLLPLGSYANLAPQIGYRHLELFERPTAAGIDVGLTGVLVLSPRAADMRLTQTFLAPGSTTETSVTEVAASYAITRQIRVASRIQWRRSPARADSRIAIGFEVAL